MKQAIVALLLFVVSFSVFAETNRPRPGHHRPGPGHYRPAPGHHHRPVPPVIVRPRPHRPLPPVVIRPRPIPGPRSCQAVMVDRFNRVVRRYWGHEDYHSMCRSGLRACNYDLQRMPMWGHRCATVRW